jgi:hypothetical protein
MTARYGRRGSVSARYLRGLKRSELGVYPGGASSAGTTPAVAEPGQDAQRLGRLPPGR